MWQKMLQVGSGGGSESKTVSIAPDTTKLLGSITTKGGSFTAEKNCIMVGTVTGPTSENAIVYVNDEILFNVKYADTAYIGRNSSGTIASCGAFIPKGSVVTTKNNGTYSLSFYEVLES